MTGTWLTLFTVGAATFAYRLSCIEFGGSDGALLARPRWRRLLRFVPPSAFAALVAPEILVRDGSLLSNPLDPRLLAAVAALVAALLTRSVLFTLASGMIALHALSSLL